MQYPDGFTDACILRPEIHLRYLRTAWRYTELQIGGEGDEEKAKDFRKQKRLDMVSASERNRGSDLCLPSVSGCGPAVVFDRRDPRMGRDS